MLFFDSEILEMVCFLGSSIRSDVLKVILVRCWNRVLVRWFEYKDYNCYRDFVFVGIGKCLFGIYYGRRDYIY